MMSAIVRFSIHFYGVIIALACLVVLYGIYSLKRSNLDVFPEFSPTQIVIQTESPGLSAEQLKALFHSRLKLALQAQWAWRICVHSQYLACRL